MIYQIERFKNISLLPGTQFKNTCFAQKYAYEKLCHKNRQETTLYIHQTPPKILKFNVLKKICFRHFLSIENQFIIIKLTNKYKTVVHFPKH